MSASPPRCLEACGENDAVFLSNNYTTATGNTQDLGNSNTRWKFVVAHEMGHQMQARQLGALFSVAYDRQMLSPAPPLLCDCTGLNPTGNTEHCLQSTEEQGAAQIEAFAHFSSANVWNDHSLSTCNFTYYKSFRDTSRVVHTAPDPVSCLTPVKWTENHCPIAGRAAEWDWLGFLTSASRNATAPLLQPDLAALYLRQCADVGGGTTCNATDVTPWTGNNGLNLPNAASEAFGQFHPRTTTFLNAGNTYGVTR